MVYQHFTLVDNMTVAENLVLARRQHPFIFDWAAETKAVADFMARMPFKLDPQRPVRMLAAGEKQKLEILKQLYLGSSIVILDEPTSVLTPAEADDVLGLLRGMAQEGRLTILMISHKFREVMAFADEVTVLRRGRPAGSWPRRRPDPRSDGAHDGRRRAAARDRNAPGRRRRVGGAGDRRAVGRGRSGHARRCTKFSLQVRAGEIVGIAGVSGNGQEELVEVLAGQRSASAGKIAVNGTPYTAKRFEMRSLKVRCLPDEPLRNACVGGMSVAENIGFRLFDRHPFTFLKALVSGRALRKNASSLIVEYGIRTPGPDAPIGSLSGGNVQRAVLARELSDDVALLIASNPCFGLDFAAVAEIRTRLMEARNRGAAVLLISADLDEIFALADRIVVISDGHAVHETPIAEADLGVIGRHMAGHA